MDRFQSVIDFDIWLCHLFQVEGQSVELRPIYILDPTFFEKFRMGANRWRFLHQSLVDLDKNLRNLGSRLVHLMNLYSCCPPFITSLPLIYMPSPIELWFWPHSNYYLCVMLIYSGLLLRNSISLWRRSYFIYTLFHYYNL